MGRPAHILFHHFHPARWFQVKTAAVECNAFANQGDQRGGLTSLFTPIDIDQAWRDFCRPANGMDRGIFFRQIIANRDVNVSAMAFCQCPGFIFQPLGGQVIGRGIDQVTGEIHPRDYR